MISTSEEHGTRIEGEKIEIMNDIANIIMSSAQVFYKHESKEDVLKDLQRCFDDGIKESTNDDDVHSNDTGKEDEEDLPDFLKKADELSHSLSELTTKVRDIYTGLSEIIDKKDAKEVIKIAFDAGCMSEMDGLMELAKKSSSIMRGNKNGKAD